MMSSGSPDVGSAVNAAPRSHAAGLPSFENLASVLQLNDTLGVESSRPAGNDHFALPNSDLKARAARLIT